ncbi:MAG: thiamine phosphate synthase [Pararhodobacter sp.]
MSDQPDHPQLYLVTPPAFDVETFPATLDALLAVAPVACIRLSVAASDEAEITRAADAIREVAHRHDIAVVIDRHAKLAARLGLDGVHLPEGARGIRKLRDELGPDAIIGAACGASRHDGMTAAEAGADYIAFGPVGDSPLGSGERADAELFAWWTEMIEVPVVAEGALTPEFVTLIAPFTDFFAFGAELWSAPDPVAALKALIKPLGL